MSGHRPDEAWRVLLHAGERAQQLRNAEAGGGDGYAGSVFKVPSTHTAAHLLNALDEQGWELRRKRKPLTEEDWNAS